MRRKDTGNSLIKLGEGLEAIIILLPIKPLKKWKLISNNDSDSYKNVT